MKSNANLNFRKRESNAHSNLCDFGLNDNRDELVQKTNSRGGKQFAKVATADSENKYCLTQVIVLLKIIKQHTLKSNKSSRFRKCEFNADLSVCLSLTVDNLVDSGQKAQERVISTVGEEFTNVSENR